MCHCLSRYAWWREPSWRWSSFTFNGGFRSQADCPFIPPQVRLVFVPEVVGSVLHPQNAIYFAFNLLSSTFTPNTPKQSSWAIELNSLLKVNYAFPPQGFCLQAVHWAHREQPTDSARDLATCSAAERLQAWPGAQFAMLSSKSWERHRSTNSYCFSKQQKWGKTQEVEIYPTKTGILEKTGILQAKLNKKWTSPYKREDIIV